MTTSTALTTQPIAGTALATVTTKELFARHLPALTSRETVDHHTALIPAEEARAIIAKVDEALSRRAAPAEAAALAAKLIGCYPSQDRRDKPAYNDPALFVAELAELFSEFPAQIGAGAVKQLLREHKWPPSLAEVHTALKAARAVWIGYRHRSDKHLAEAERRAAELKRAHRLVDPAIAQGPLSRLIGAWRGDDHPAIGGVEQSQVK